MTDDEDHAFVAKQPATPDDIELAEESMESCPEECIGNDGA